MSVESDKTWDANVLLELITHYMNTVESTVIDSDSMNSILGSAEID